ncbi:MAG: acyloxyacyl hydrolase [Pelagibacteraceae bacterium]|nr:acyloxyacyl hydrolase [Pelagibacteraceae bacterium]
MKKLILLSIVVTFLANTHLLSAEKSRSLLEKLLNKDLPGGSVSTSTKSRKAKKIINQEMTTKEIKEISKLCKNTGKRSLLEKALGKDLPGGSVSTSTKARKNTKQKCSTLNQQAKIKNKTYKSSFSNSDRGQDVSFYTGIFDTIDKEGDDKTNLLGFEHKNKNLFRETWLGRISPTSGAFVTGKSSIYLYTGIAADYNLGPLSISPSFAPGYYEAGDGKKLGSALEFKSEVKIGLDLFKNSNLGYSYSHISNNDWGSINPGTDNQSINFSKKF